MEITISYYGLTDEAEPNVIRYVGMTYNKQCREEYHSMAKSSGKYSICELWKYAVRMAGRRVVFDVLHEITVERQQRWPHVPQSAVELELTVMHAMQAAGGHLLNREILIASRRGLGISAVSHVCYLAALRNSILRGCSSSLSLIEQMESLQPSAFHVLARGNLLNDIRSKQEEVKGRVASGKRPCSRRARRTKACIANASASQ